MYDLRSDGVWLSSIGPWGDLSVTWIWGGALLGGLGEASWQMDVAPNFNHPALHPGSLIEVMDGALPVGRGILREPGRTDSGLSFQAFGVQREAEHLVALDSSNNSTSIADTAVDVAIANGWQVTRPVSLAAAPLKTADAVQGANYLDTILLLLADELGQQVYVDGYGALRRAADSTTPTWHIIPGLVDLGVAGDDYASQIIGRYIDSTTHNYTSVVATDPVSTRWGVRQYPVDMTLYGEITAFRANARVNGLLTKGKSKLTFTDRLEVSAGDIFTADGLPAPLSMVRAGHLARVHGVDGEALAYNRLNYVDLTLGEVVDPQDDQTITIAPVDLGARTVADNLAVTTADRSFKA